MKTHTPALRLVQNIRRMCKVSRTWPAMVTAVMLVAAGANATDLVWSGGTGNWNAAGNWTPQQIPGAADNAFITNNGTYTVTIPQNTPITVASLTVGGASGTQTLAIDKTTLTLNGPGLINANGHLDFLFSGSTLTGAGNLTVNGTLNWANGAMNGTGITTIGSGGVLAIGSGGETLGRSLNNGGAGTWAGGNLTMSAGVTFNNLAGGTFDITADGRLSGAATTPINNSGLFRLTAGTVSTIVTAPFNNSGTLQVQAVALSLSLGGTHTGTMAIAAGATLNFAGGSHVLGASSLVTGAGALTLSGGATTLTASGTFDVGSTLTLSIISGVGTLSPGCIVTGATINVGGGILNYNSASSVAVVNLTAGTLGGTSPVTVTGPLTLGGGTVTNALVTANGGLTINGNTTLNGGKLVNPGLATWSAGNFTGANGAVLSNLFGATFNNTFDGNAASGAGATPSFVNAGSFRKTGATAAAGTTSIDFQFINTGTVEVQTNTLRYGINQQTAGVTLLDGGGLTAQAQPIQLLGGSLVGTGLVTVANTLTLINSATVSPGLPLGELDISGNYQQTGTGVLDIDLGGYSAGTGFDLITVTGGGAGGVATLGGTLNVTLTNGFSPTNGATFTFLTALSRVGSFATFNYPSNDIGMQLNIDPTSATIKVTNLKPLVANPIVAPAPGAYGAAFSFQFPANTFTDPDGDLLTYTATGMPPGITFTGSTRTFAGTPTQAGVFSVAVAATDSGTPHLTVTNTFTITINPATLTIAALPQSKSYGATDPTLNFTVGGLQFSDTPATVLTGGLARAAGESVVSSPYAITQGTLTANTNYTISFTGDALTITPATLTIAAQSKTKTYGAADPALTFAVGGLQFSDTPATVLTGALARALGETVTSSPYPITQGTLTANNNYSISFTGSTLAITPVTLTITASAQSKTYGAALGLGTSAFTTSGLQNGETVGAVTLTASGSPAGTAATAAAGQYTITPSGATGGTFTPANYAITYATGALTVNPAALTVTASAQSKTYGATLVLGTSAFSTSGLQNGETVGSVTLTASGSPAGTAATAAAGPYTITPSSATGGTFSTANYTITYATGTLTVSPAALAITASAQSKTYGASLVLDTSAFTTSGLQNGETVGSVTLTASGSPAGTAATAAVGPYNITPSAATGGTFNAANYTITYAAGTLTVNQAALTITATAQSKTYGTTLVLGTSAFTTSGLQNGETVGSATLTASGSPAGTAATAAAGPYTITPSAATGGTFSAANYTITYATGTLTVNPAALTVTATAQSKSYGTTLVLGTSAFTTSGLQNGETVGSVTLTASGSPAGTAATAAVDPYTITPSAATGGTFSVANYTITYATGALTVNPAALTVTASAQSKTYGATLVLGTSAFTTSGLQNGETVGSVTLAASGSPTGTAATAAAGPYTITPSAATGGTFTPANYAITYAMGTLTVNPAGLTVTATAQSKAYGTTLVLGTSAFTTSGLQNSETVGAVTLTASGSPAGNTAAAAAGPYTIRPSAATGGTFSPTNYAISYATGTLTVNPTALTVTASAQSKTYGATLVLGTSAFTSSGLQNGETVGSVTLAASGSPAGTSPTAAAGPYIITPSAATGGTFTPANYAITYATGTLTVNPAALTVTADAKTKTAGAADPAFTASYAGLVNGETPAILGGTLSFARVPGESVGSYLITPSGLTSANYSITFNTGTLTITASAPLILALTSAAITNVVISWSAVSNATYRVQYKGVLSSTNWTDLTGDVLAVGSTASKTDIKTTTNRFYRVQVLP